MKNVLILVFLCYSLSLTGTTYYIDPSGSNSNTGSASSPWKTLSYACSKATVSGDIIHVNAGIYTETTQCSLATGVNIIGAGKTTAIIKSDYYVERTGGDYTGPAIYLNGASEGTMGNQSISNLTIDGDNLTGGVAIAVRQLGGVTIHDCIIRDFYIGGIIFNASSGPFSEPSSKALNNSVYNCTILNCSNTANQWNSAGCIGYAGQSGLLIHDNTFDLTYRARGLNGDILTGGFFCENIKIYNNVFTRLENEMHNGQDGWSFFMEIFNTRGGFELYNNQFYGGECVIDVACGTGGGHYKGKYDYCFYIHDNYIEPTITEQSMNRCAIILEDNNLNDIIITRNHFKNCAEVFELSSVKSEASDCNNITFNYNILEHCGWHYAGGASYIMKIRNSDIIKNFDNVSICNNVIIGDQIASNYGILVECHGTMTNINIKNNIVEHLTTRAWLIITNNGTMNGFHADYNNLYDNANSNLPSVSGNSVSNYTFLNNINSDPLFLSSSDFHLQSGSPAIGKGVSVAGLVVDYAGNSIKNPPSIGAYESSSAVALPVLPVYQSSSVENATPSSINMTYNLSLNNLIVSTAASFSVIVNSTPKTVSAVAVSGTKVKLTLANRIFPTDKVTVSYTKPATNPIQTVSGGIAASISNQQVTNNCINTAPIAVITSPLTNSSFSGSANITITASALDTDGSVTLVEFYNGITKLGSKSSAPYTFTWNNVTAGNYSLSVSATDNLNAKTTSSSISISVANIAPKTNQHPIVKILNPSKGIKFEKLSAVSIDAIASDPDGSISKVEFYSGSVKLVELTSAPYTYTWKDVLAGNYSIIAIATDNLNDTTISSPVEFEIGSTVKYDVNSEIVKLYPNPNNGHFSVEFINPLQNDKSEIVITDLAGKLVYNGPVLKEDKLKQIDVSGSRSGIYVMMIKDKDILVTKKFIKN